MLNNSKDGVTDHTFAHLKSIPGRKRNYLTSVILVPIAVMIGAFHSPENSQNFETGTNGLKISWESFQKIRKLWNFWKVNHSTENPWNSGRKFKETEIPGKKLT